MSELVLARLLDDLSAGRRATFLRRRESEHHSALRRTPDLTFDAFLDRRWNLLADSCAAMLAYSRVCGFERPQLARPGSDGRFHPWSPDGGLLCGREIHRQKCTWSTDGTRWSIHFVAGGADGQRERRWRVRLVGEPVPAESLTWSQRCPLLPRSAWPTYFNPSTPVGAVRAALIRHAGHDRCQTCGAAQGELIDHDHLSGLVRGLLCGNCNTHVDDCPHLAGCPFGAYLDHPPAVHLELRHPKRGRVGTTAQRAGKPAVPLPTVLADGTHGTMTG